MTNQRNPDEDAAALLLDLTAALALHNWLLEQHCTMIALNAADPIAMLKVTEKRAAADIALTLDKRKAPETVKVRTLEGATRFWARVRERIQVRRAANGNAPPSTDKLQ